ncbi:MAG: MgtC/SapB family protein [Vicinamibacterales bacterium]
MLTADLPDDVWQALVRLPIAALLGAALAFRPKRRGTPTRTPAVVQTQIILAVVGAVIMLVVGASLARAFGIVGAANLIRYRAKIEDPKDAAVMLCCLAVGLASGVGLYALAGISTLFLVGMLAAIESFEPNTSQTFELRVKAAKDTPELRAKLEHLLERFDVEHSLRSTSDDELTYLVKVPFGVETDPITDRIQLLSKDDTLAVSWDDKKPKKPA